MLLHGNSPFDTNKKIIFKRIYNFLLQENLLNPNTSDFHSSDSCLNQLLAITNEIFEAFDYNPPLEVRSVFLDISKAFTMGILAELHKPLENYLLSRLRRVVLNSQSSLWRPVLASVLQGSTLGPLLLLIYIK